MYQFSLDAYIELFSNSIDKSLKHPRLEERIQYLNDYHTFAVYQYTCRGLFERHKLLFSFQMCAKILEAAGKLNLDEYNFFLRGGIVSSFPPSLPPSLPLLPPSLPSSLPPSLASLPPSLPLSPPSLPPSRSFCLLSLLLSLRLHLCLSFSHPLPPPPTSPPPLPPHFPPPHFPSPTSPPLPPSHFLPHFPLPPPHFPPHSPSHFLPHFPLPPPTSPLPLTLLGSSMHLVFPLTQSLCFPLHPSYPLPLLSPPHPPIWYFPVPAMYMYVSCLSIILFPSLLTSILPNLLPLSPYRHPPQPPPSLLP